MRELRRRFFIKLSIVQEGGDHTPSQTIPYKVLMWREQ